MTQVVGYDEFTRMMLGAVQAIHDHHEELSHLDAVIGDGDHGVTMQRAATAIQGCLKPGGDGDLKTLVNDIGWALLSLDSGATGPLLGTLFLGMADGISHAPLDGPALAAAFETGLAALRQQTKAQVGDKTMMDALIPAVAALRAAADEGASIEVMLGRAAQAAHEGALATRDMQAHFGRAKHQGARTLGTQDPGATSMAYLFAGFRAGLAQPSLAATV